MTRNTMNRKYLSFTILLILSIFINVKIKAQIFEGEITTGLCTSQIDGDKLDGFNKMGGFAGFYVRAHLSEKAAIQSGIHYIGKGSKEKIESNGIVYSTTKVGLHYLEVPFQFRYTYKKVLFFDAGLSFAYLIGSRFEENGEEIDKNRFHLSDFDYCLNFSIGYHITEKFDAALKFSNTFPTPHASITDDRNLSNWFNRLIVLTVSYRLNFAENID